MLGKDQKEIIHALKSKVKRHSLVQTKSSSNILKNDKNKTLKKFILKLRNKAKYSLLNFFNSK